MAKRKGKNIEDTNRVIRSHKNKGEQTAKWPKRKGKNRQIMIYKKPHRKSETEQQQELLTFSEHLDQPAVFYRFVLFGL
jgi:hypothetical protein